MPPKKGKRGGGDSDDDDVAAPSLLPMPGKPGKKKGADSDDDEGGGGKQKGRSQLKKEAAAAAKETSSKADEGGGGGKKSKRGKRGGGDSDDEEEAAAPLPLPAKSGGGDKKSGNAAPTSNSGDKKSGNAAPTSNSAPSKKKGGKGKRGGDDDDDDDDDAAIGMLAGMPTPVGNKGSKLAAAAREVDDDEDDDDDKKKKSGGGGGGKKKKGKKPGRQGEDSDDEALPAVDATASTTITTSTLSSLSKSKKGQDKVKSNKKNNRFTNDDDDEEEEDDDEEEGGDKAEEEKQNASNKARLAKEVEDEKALLEEKQRRAEEERASAAAAIAAAALLAAEAERSAALAASAAISATATSASATEEGDVLLDFGAKKKKKKKAFVLDEGDEEPIANSTASTAPAPVAAATLPSPPPPTPAPALPPPSPSTPASGLSVKAKKDAAKAAKEASAAAAAAAAASSSPPPTIPSSKSMSQKKETEDGEKGEEGDEDNKAGGGGEVFFGEAEMGASGFVNRSAGASEGYTGKDAEGNPIGFDGETVTSELASALVNLANGKKLSNRESKLTKQYELDRASRGPMKAGGDLLKEGDEFGLRNFALSQQSKAKSGTTYDAASENSKDVVIENFSINANKKQLFVNASLRIAHGRRYGLVGPNGQGKSTLLKYMAARELAIPARIDLLYVEQEVVADETPAIQAVLKADKKRAALLLEEKEILEFLDNEDANESKRVSGGKNVPAAAAESERNKREDRLNAVYEELAASKADASEAAARSILSGLGFTVDMQERPTKQFSGGWRMRISLARALFMQPDLLLLDEPTNHLDLNAVIWLEDYLSRWKSTLLVVSHDQDFLSGVVTDIIHLEEQKLFYYKGNYDDFKAMHEQKMEKQQKDYDKQQKQLQQMKAKGKSSKEADAVAKSRAKREGASNDKKKSGNASSADLEGSDMTAGSEHLIKRPREYVVRFNFRDPEPLPPPVMSVNNVSFKYGPKYPYLFKDLNFGIDQKSRIAIVGPNGVGKSTLLNLLIGDLEVVEGDVVRNRFLKVGKYSQHFVDVLPMDKRPVDFIMQFHDDTPGDKLGNARALLGRFGLEGHAHTIEMRDLSGGQKARVVFAGLALAAPHIMVLDEPTNNLDIESIDALGDALTQYEGGVVLVSHDSRLIRNAECQLWVCDKQSVKPFDGNIDDYRASMIQDIHKEEEELRRQQAAEMAAEEEKRMADFRKRLIERKKAQAAAASVSK
jgi:ATP-binding cassette, subfamily F, member 1